MKNVHFKIFKMIATSGFLTAVECTKSRRSPRPASRLGRGTPPRPHYPPPSTPSASRSCRLRRLVLGAFGASFPKPPPKFFSGYGPAPMLPTRVFLPNLVVLCQTVRALLRKSTRKFDHSRLAFQGHLGLPTVPEWPGSSRN